MSEKPRVLHEWESGGYRYRLAERADRGGALRPEIFWGAWIAAWKEPAVVHEIARLAERVRELEERNEDLTAALSDRVCEMLR